MFEGYKGTGDDHDTHVLRPSGADDACRMKYTRSMGRLARKSRTNHVRKYRLAIAFFDVSTRPKAREKKPVVARIEAVFTAIRGSKSRGNRDTLSATHVVHTALRLGVLTVFRQPRHRRDTTPSTCGGVAQHTTTDYHVCNNMRVWVSDRQPRHACCSGVQPMGTYWF